MFSVGQVNRFDILVLLTITSGRSHRGMNSFLALLRRLTRFDSFCYVMLRHASSCFVVLRRASSCFVVLRRASSCFVVLLGRFASSFCFAV